MAGRLESGPRPSQAGGLRWYGAFRDAAAEAAFRTHALPQDRQTYLVAAGICVLGAAAFMVNDIVVFFNTGRLLEITLGTRVLVLGYGALAMPIVSRVRHYRTLDGFTAVLVLLVAFQTYAANASRPPDHVANAGVDVIILMGFYVLAPMALPLRFAAGLLYTLGLLWMHYGFKAPMDTLTDLSVTTGLVLGNLVGIAAELRLARSRRAEYARLVAEQAARSALEDARSEVRTLAGLIPICSSCKSVRNDEGYWEQVESYVRKHSGAEFSHSICPTCAEKHYGADILDKLHKQRHDTGA